MRAWPGKQGKIIIHFCQQSCSLRASDHYFWLFSHQMSHYTVIICLIETRSFGMSLVTPFFFLFFFNLCISVARQDRDASSCSSVKPQSHHSLCSKLLCKSSPPSLPRIWLDLCMCNSSCQISQVRSRPPGLEPDPGARLLWQKEIFSLPSVAKERKNEIKNKETHSPLLSRPWEALKLWRVKLKYFIFSLKKRKKTKEKCQRVFTTMSCPRGVEL